MKKITVEVYLTTGQTFRVKCEKFNVHFGIDNAIDRYTVEGHKSGHGVHLRPELIAGFRRVK